MGRLELLNGLELVELELSLSVRLTVGFVKFRGANVRLGSVPRLKVVRACVGLSVVVDVVERLVEYRLRVGSVSSPDPLVSFRLRLRLKRSRLNRWLSGLADVVVVDDVVSVVEGVDRSCFLLISLMLNRGRLAILFKTLLSSCSTEAIELGWTDVVKASAVVGIVVKASFLNFRFGSFKLDLIS